MEHLESSRLPGGLAYEITTWLRLMIVCSLQAVRRGPVVRRIQMNSVLPSLNRARDAYRTSTSTSPRWSLISTPTESPLRSKYRSTDAACTLSLRTQRCEIEGGR